MPKAWITSPSAPSVGDTCDVTVTIESDKELIPGDTIEWQLPHSWTAVGDGPTYTKEFNTTDPLAPHYIESIAPSAMFEISVEPQHLPDRELPTRHGRRFTATVTSGRVKPMDKVQLCLHNTTASVVAGTESVQVQVNRNEPTNLPELTTCPGEFERLRVLVPSSVQPSERFPLAVVPLDEFDNAAESTHTDDLTLDDGTVVRGDLSVTGPQRIQVAIDDPGVHRFRYDGVISNPIRIDEESSNLLWGDTHAHTGLSHDGQGSHPYRYARDVSQLDFAAVTDHAESLGDEGHDRVLEWNRAAQDPEDSGFVAIPAYERQLPSAYNKCHCNLYFATADAYKRQVDRDDVALLAGDRDADDPIEPDLIMPHHTGVSAYACNLDDLNEVVPAMEVYSHHGQAEYYAPQHTLAYEFNRLRKRERRVNHSMKGPHYLQDFLANGHRIGVVGSSDDHTGRPGRPEGGIVAVRGTDRSRKDIIEAINERRSYATTGERILLMFSVAGEQMGGETAASKGEEIEVDLEVHATDRLLNIEVLRYRPNSNESFVPVFREAPDATPSSEGEDTQSTPNAGNAPRSETASAKYKFNDTHGGTALYYCRATQAPVERPGMAWSSPVWVGVK